MIQAAISPLPAADKIAGLLIHLEQAFAPTLTLTTLAVRRGQAIAAHVIVHLDDGSRHWLDAGDARVMARCLRDDHGEAEGQPAEWAVSLESAADAAERQASAILLGMGQGGGVTPARSFGAR
ncbi:MAG TPA: hypothetical protein VFW13_07025 [Phenylobacterium sp.]|nr:hypothetical protein [Phenylobacterium sp.]